MAGSRATADVASDDAKLLESLGYKQELSAAWAASPISPSHSPLSAFWLGVSLTTSETGTGSVRCQTAADPWSPLRRFTSARIALGRAGGSVPTNHQLAFRFDHARARVAVWSPFDDEHLAQQLQALGHEVLVVGSRVRDRSEFLQRPDLGRCLDEESQGILKQRATRAAGYDLVIIISDGLSTLAAGTQSVPLVRALAE